MATLSWTLATASPSASASASSATPSAAYAPWYGSYIGSYYGGLDFFAAVMRDRTLRFLRMGPNMRGIVGVIGDRGAAYQRAATDVTEAFDIDTAIGAQLDVLGGILQRPRLGANDDDYRKLLKIQVEFLLSSNGSVTALLDVVSFFADAAATEYRENYPRSLSVGVRLDTLAERDTLLDLIRQGRSSGTAYSLAVELDDDIVRGDFVGETETDPGSSDFIGGPAVADAYNTPILKAGT